MPVVNVDLSFDGGVSVRIGRAVTESAFHAAASHPRGVAFVVVVTAIAILTMGRASKLACPDHERVFEKITTLEISK